MYPEILDLMQGLTKKELKALKMECIRRILLKDRQEELAAALWPAGKGIIAGK